MWRCEACKEEFVEGTGRGTVGAKSWCSVCISAGHMPGFAGTARELSAADRAEMGRGKIVRNLDGSIASVSDGSGAEPDSTITWIIEATTNEPRRIVDGRLVRGNGQLRIVSARTSVQPARV